MNLLYNRIQNFPSFIRSMVYTHDGWIVGGAAKFMVGLIIEVVDELGGADTKLGRKLLEAVNVLCVKEQ